MKTIPQILTEIRKQRPCSRATLYRFFQSANIRPMGDIRQRPQLFTDDVPARFLGARGYEGPELPSVSRLVRLSNATRARRAQRATRKGGRK